MSAEKKIPMTTEKVYSPIFDKDIEKNVSDSPMWKTAHHPDELDDVKGPLVEYTVKFDGLTPVQVKKFRKLKR